MAWLNFAPVRKAERLAIALAIAGQKHGTILFAGPAAEGGVKRLAKFDRALA